MSEEKLSCKVIFVGESGVGKTSIFNRYISNTFESETKTTCAASYRSKIIYLEEVKKTITLDFWDTAGNPAYYSLLKYIYKDAEVIILVYDITKRSSFDKLNEFWIPELKENAPSDSSKFLYID